MKQVFLILSMWISISLTAQENFVYANYINGTNKHELGATSLVSSFGKENIFLDDNIIKINNYKGTPLLLKSWAQAEVLFSDGKLYKMPYVNYDALSDQFVVYLKGNKVKNNELFDKDLPLISLKPEDVVSLTLKNADNYRKFIKVSELHFLNPPKTRFFEYYSDSPEDAFVLRSYLKKIAHNRLSDMPYSDSLEEFVFNYYDQDYIKNNNGMYIPVKLKKKTVFKVLNDPKHEKALKNYIKKHKLKMSKPEDVQKLLEYYYKELTSSTFINK